METADPCVCVCVGGGGREGGKGGGDFPRTVFGCLQRFWTNKLKPPQLVNFAKIYLGMN